MQSRYYNPEWGRFINADSFVSTGQGILGNNMFAYCNNNPTNLYDKSGKMPDTLAGWIGEKIGEFFFECITGDDHPNKEAETLNNRIRQKQLQSAKKGAKTAWDNYMRWNNLQQEAQLMEAQMIAQVSPRIINAGLDEGAKAAIAAVTVYGLQNNGQPSDPKSVATTAAVSFVGGFVAGAAIEVFNICKELVLAN